MVTLYYNSHINNFQILRDKTFISRSPLACAVRCALSQFPVDASRRRQFSQMLFVCGVAAAATDVASFIPPHNNLLFVFIYFCFLQLAVRTRVLGAHSDAAM